MTFENVIPHLVHSARMHRSNALVGRDAAEVARFEALVTEYDAAIRKLTDGAFCALDAAGVPLVKVALPQIGNLQSSIGNQEHP